MRKGHMLHSAHRTCWFVPITPLPLNLAFCSGPHLSNDGLLLRLSSGDALGDPQTDQTDSDNEDDAEDDDLQ